MERDRSLDEFLGGESDDGGDGSGEDGGGGAEVDRAGGGGETDLAGDGTVAGDASERESEDSAALDADEGADAVDPATITYQWTPTGTTCDRCGARVERRWRDDGAYVCEDCKEW